MLFSKNPVLVLSSPKVGILDLIGEQTKEILESDAGFLKPLFAEVQVVDLAAPTCDVLFLYAKLTAAGAVLGSARGLREIIRDSGAKVVVVASPNPGTHYIKAGKQKPYGQANLIMALDRRESAFGRFLSALFSKMKEGTSMPSAWAELNLQAPGREKLDYPEAIFACEIGPLTFGT